MTSQTTQYVSAWTEVLLTLLNTSHCSIQSMANFGITCFLTSRPPLLTRITPYHILTLPRNS